MLQLLYRHRVRLFNPMIWMQGSVSHVASLQIRVRSLALWLLFICLTHTHRKIHAALVRLPSLAWRLLHILSHHTHTLAFPLPALTCCYFFDRHILPVPRKCSCDLPLPPDLSPQSTHTNTLCSSSTLLFHTLDCSHHWFLSLEIAAQCMFKKKCIICGDWNGPHSGFVMPSMAFSHDSYTSRKQTHTHTHTPCNITQSLPLYQTAYLLHTNAESMHDSCILHIHTHLFFLFLFIASISLIHTNTHIQCFIK